MEKEEKTKRNRINICCFSSRYVHKKVLQSTPENREKHITKSLSELAEERRQQNPIKMWINKFGEMCMCNMNTLKGIKL